MEFKANSEADYIIDGVKIHTYFFSYTPGKPTGIIIHGHRSDTLRLISIINLLEEKYNVIGFDLPGFGKSNECGEYDDYVEYCAGVLAKMFDALELHTEEIMVLGISLGGNILVNYLINNPESKFARTGLIAPIYSRKNLSMKPKFKKFVFWFTNALSKGRLVYTLVQGVINSDRLFGFFTKLVDKKSAADKQTLEYEKRQWRLMTMQHWGKSLRNLLETDYSELDVSFDPGNVIFVYPKADQYIDAKASIAGFTKMFPKAEFKELNSEMHIPRGDFGANREIQESIQNLIDALA